MLLPSLNKAAALLLALSVLSACAKSGDGTDLSEPLNCEVSGQSYGIVGGQVLGSGNELSSSTVMVIHVNTAKETSICTGTLISHDKVLTAAHCTSYGGKSIIAFTNNLGCAAKAQGRTLRKVTTQAIHPYYSYNSSSIDKASYDLSILKFTGSVPEGYKARPLPSVSFKITVNAELAMTGYGTTVEKGEDSGLLRYTTAPASRLLKNIKMLASNESITVPQTLLLQQYDNGVCTGDSGGPLYVNDGQKLTLVGITSMGLDNRAIRKEDVRHCHGVGIFTDVRTHLSWIHQNLNSL